MPLGAKTIRTRIRSVKNTGKITKAMELVSANKMRKASRFAQGGRSYDTSISEIIGMINVEEKEETKKEVKKIAILLFSGNRGLCGSFNSQVISFARKSALERIAGQNIEAVWIPIGKKGSEALVRAHEKIEAEFKKTESGEEVAEFFNIGKYLNAEFEKGNFDEVWLSYTDFISSLKQIPRFKLLLPIQNESPSDQSIRDENIIFEPNKKELLSYLVPRFIETRLYQALLESNASEHSSRMLAMKNASDACRDITDELTYLGNSLRQAGITREIIEIAGAKAAISSE